MSIAVLPASSAAANHLTDPSFSVSAEPHLEVENEPFRHRVVPVRRRGNAEQGRALEMLGHAVEYLADSRLFLLEEVNQRDEDEAMQILMRMSRAVFSECPEVVPMGARIGLWMSDFISRTMHAGRQPHG